MKLEMLFLLLVLGIIGARGNSGSTNDQAPVPAVHDDLEEAPVEGVNGSTNSPVEHTEVVHEGDHGNTTHTGKHHVERYHVAVFDFENVAAPFLISLWIVLASAAKMGFHMNNKLSSVFPESCLLILLGVILGTVLSATDLAHTVLDSHTFFLFLLPPIILDAGYFMPNRALFDNIGTILLLAVLGTLLNTLLIGFSLWGFSQSGAVKAFPFELNLLHCLVFSSLLSAVDPVAVLAVFEEIHVNELLHITVFGESLLNDGVTVVLYHLFHGLTEIGEENIIPLDVVFGVLSFFIVVLGGTGIGVLFGLLTALVSRFTDHVRVIEPLVVFVMGYLSYITAEMFHLSGILSCTFCAITMKKYVEANISQKSHTTIKYFLKMLASVSETIIFVILGISTVNAPHDWDTGFCLLTLVFCLVYRGIVVCILMFFANHFRLIKLNGVDQFIMVYGGLRGAIAFSLVVLLDRSVYVNHRMFVTTTLLVIYFTVFVQGSTIKPLVNLFRVKKADKHKPTLNEQVHLRLIDHLMAGVEDVTGNHGHHQLRLWFEYINIRYLKPVLVRRKVLRQRGLSILNVYEKLKERDARELVSSGSFTDLLAMHHMSQSMADHMHYVSLHGSDPHLGTGRLSVLPDPENEDPTQLDTQVASYTSTRKSRDDSRVHHMMADVMFHPRKKFHHHRRHMLPDLDHHDHVIHHKTKLQLRHILRHHKANQMQQPNGHAIEDSKPSKNVSFGRVTQVISKDEAEEISTASIQAAASESSSSCSSVSDRIAEISVLSDDEGQDGIVFTVPKSEENYEVRVPDTPTAAETSLPWKRNTGRPAVPSSYHNSYQDDCNPLTGEAPSWVKGVETGETSVDDLSKADPSAEDPPKESVEKLQNKSNGPDVSIDIELEQVQPQGLPHPDLAGYALWNEYTQEEVLDEVAAPCVKEEVPLGMEETDTVLPPPWRSQGPAEVIRPSASHPSTPPCEEDSHIPPPPWRQNSAEHGAMCSPSVSHDLEIYSMRPQPSCQSFLMSEAESKHSEHVPVHHIIECTQARHAGDIDEMLPSQDPSLSETMDRVTNWVLALKPPEDETLLPWNGEAAALDAKGRSSISSSSGSPPAAAEEVT